MNCTEYRKRISLLVDGELAEHARAPLMKHLDACPMCRAFSEEIAALDSSVRALRTPGPDPALALRVRESIAERRSADEPGRGFPKWAAVAATAAMIVTAVGLGNLAGRSIGDMISRAPASAQLEYLLPDAGQSFADMFTELNDGDDS